ncbi:unnamed protein product [Zymoseptoria tritici ST99CH_3D1]|uniref:AMP-dependent synthetase/ligase domain-containing protein n=1 Tax=Zymoseptoria tritici ST99CH_1E4 TaxID=1276532 RepID=A0A2H1GLD5_ZYMTR|nr:unnamed protein product [Zymoseptoria tritici ST99CH_1E4]SMR56334.1 unnamed protein product [Zymoseptoria tritici ST99CH_3D1]
MLRQAGVQRVLVEESSYAEDMINSGFFVVDISALEITSGLDKKVKPLDTEPDPKDKAFVAFTSGSTGTPKGIIQTHQGIVTVCQALANQLHVTSSSRVAQFHPYIFDVALMEIGMCLGTGATLCISKKKDMMLPLPGEVGSQLTAFGITHVTMSPTMLETMDPGDVPTVEVLSVMGESLGRHAVEQWASTASRTFYQLWGCTEATILQSITTAITATHAPRDVGQAIGDTCRLWIVDPANVNKLMAEAAAGELVVESRALARGYINQPEDTLRRFVERADWMDVASRGTLYKTGDLAQKEADGSITFLGRLDSQMNYHGERIELGEINFHLERGRPPGVSACFSDFDVQSQTVVGFLCTKDTAETQPQELVLSWSRAGVSRCAMEHLSRDLVRKGDLPPYMVPHLWIPIRHRPLTISGKTDRTRLRSIVRNLSTKQRDEYSVH